MIQAASFFHCLLSCSESHQPYHSQETAINMIATGMPTIKVLNNNAITSAAESVLNAWAECVKKEASIHVLQSNNDNQ